MNPKLKKDKPKFTAVTGPDGTTKDAIQMFSGAALCIKTTNNVYLGPTTTLTCFIQTPRANRAVQALLSNMTFVSGELAVEYKKVMKTGLNIDRAPSTRCAGIVHVGDTLAHH